MAFKLDALLALIKESKSQLEAAAILGVSESAVSKRLKKVQGAVNSNIALYASKKVLDAQLYTAEQLWAIGRQTRELLEMLNLCLHGNIDSEEKARSARSRLQRLAGPKRDLLSYIPVLQSELRKQLEFDFNMRKEIYNLRQAQDFQDVVLAEIKACAPEVAQRIVSRLAEIQATRSSLDFGLNQSG